MNQFLTFAQELCGNELPTVLGIFDFSTAHPMLYYSYIPIMIASFCIGWYIYSQNRASPQAQALFVMTCLFVLWVLNILVQWVASYHRILMFGWQLTALIEVGLFLSAVAFAYAFLYRRHLPLTLIAGIGVLISIIGALTPTTFNIASYDLYNCEGITGTLWDIIYVLEPALIVVIAALGIDAYRKQTNPELKGEVLFASVGIVTFLSIFFASNLYGEITRIYEFNLWGPLGMLCLLLLLGYVMVRYHTFSTKLFATQALVASTTLLIGSQLFLDVAPLHFAISVITLLAFLGSGYFLVQSVRREISLRESLEIANQQQESLLHFISHEVKGYLAKSQAGFASIVEGDFGDVAPPLLKMAEVALSDTRKGVDTVMDILDASNLKRGTISYAKARANLKTLVESVLHDLEIAAKAKGLSLHLDADQELYEAEIDAAKFRRHVVRNLIDNAIRYTPSGSVTVALSETASAIILSVTDTGVGITPEDMHHLFTEGGKGKDSTRVNVDSTGYGLYVAKSVVEGHGGTIRAESKGAGTGSRFTVTLPKPTKTQ